MLDGAKAISRVVTDVVFAFTDERPAIFSKFQILIPGANHVLKEFEILVSDDSPTGTFRSLGPFTTHNTPFVKSPFQDFKFPETTARYLKLRTVSGRCEGFDCAVGVTQIRLMGQPPP